MIEKLKNFDIYLKNGAYGNKDKKISNILDMELKNDYLIIKYVDEEGNYKKIDNRIGEYKFKPKEQDKVDKAIKFIEEHNANAGNLYYKYNNKYLLSEIKEDLLKILKGEE